MRKHRSEEARSVVCDVRNWSVCIIFTFKNMAIFKYIVVWHELREAGKGQRGTRPSGLVKCQRISILLLGNCARISQTFGVNIQIFEYISAAAGPGWIGKYTKWRSGIKTRAWKHKYLFFKLLFELLTSLISTNYLQASININLVLQYWYVCKEKYL